MKRTGNNVKVIRKRAMREEQGHWKEGDEGGTVGVDGGAATV